MLGMAPRDGWTGWDRIDALIPESELGGLEAELRSLSHGLASYEAKFDHLAEVSAGAAEKLVRGREEVARLAEVAEAPDRAASRPARGAPRNRAGMARRRGCRG